jgi:hypothetical protein
VSVFVEVMGFGTRPGHARRREQPWEQPPCRASRCSGGSAPDRSNRDRHLR